jgi:hypothetical protein
MDKQLNLEGFALVTRRLETPLDYFKQYVYTNLLDPVREGLGEADFSLTELEFQGWNFKVKITCLDVDQSGAYSSSVSVYIARDKSPYMVSRQEYFCDFIPTSGEGKAKLIDRWISWLTKSLNSMLFELKELTTQLNSTVIAGKTDV